MVYLTTCIIAVIILVYIAYVCGCRSVETAYLQGFWESNSEFNKEAGLQLFSMYIGCPSGSEYPTYMLMIEDDDDQTILINEPAIFSLSEPLTKKLSHGSCREFRMTFKNLETTLMPQVLKMRYYPGTCKIVLSDHKQVYAVFFKNPVISELEQIKNEKAKSPTQKNADETVGDVEESRDSGASDDVCSESEAL
jgi:hypothetical protein